MKLKIWLVTNKMSVGDFAEALGYERTLVSKWIGGHYFPRPQKLIKIMDYTGGEVTANDFLEDWEEVHFPVEPTNG